jgi:Na+-driven multidrug efflux pump
VLLGAGDNAFMRTITLLSAAFGWIPMALASLHFGWGLGGVWAGLALFIGIRFVGMTARTWSGRWIVVGESR